MELADNWASHVASFSPVEVTEEIVLAILTATTKESKEISQLQANVERAIIDAQKANDDGTTTIDTIR